MLAQSMDPIHRLDFYAWVPPWLSVPQMGRKSKDRKSKDWFSLSSFFSPNLKHKCLRSAILTSMRNTRDASVKLSATPPALSETKNTVVLGFSINNLIVASRAWGDIFPSNRQIANPARWRRNAIRSRKLTNWEKTRLLIVASSRRSLVNSSTSASILVLLRHLDGREEG